MSVTAQQSSADPSPGESPAALFSPDRLTLVAAAAVLAGLAATAYLLQGHGQARHAISVVLGAAFGVVIQRSRFCFFCMFRDWYDHRDGSGLFGLLIAIAAGVTGYTLVFGTWLPDPITGRLPPDAFIGPVGPGLVIAGLVFGLGMAISRSCISAHLYRLGEGSPTAPFALIGTVIGFIAGFLTWNTVYPLAVADAPVIWLPRHLGYSGALLAALAMIALLVFALGRSSDTPLAGAAASGSTFHKIIIARWPAWIGGAIVGVLGMSAYFRVAPLGVTAEISSQSRQLADLLGVMPIRLQGLDTLRGCVTIMRDALLSPNGAFVGAMIGAAFAAALAAGQFRPAVPTRGQIVRGLTGGILLGWGAMTGLGCTVGTLLSGVMAGALSGWVFGAAVFFAVFAALWFESRFIKSF